MESLMLTVQQVSEQLNVSDSLIYSLVEAGKIISHKIGLGRGTIRVRPEDLETYLESCRHEVQEKSKKVGRPKLKHIKLS